jgi:hypothetical protein
MNFQVGQRVICVDGTFTFHDVWEWFGRVPEEGRIYTVARVFRGPFNGRGPVGLGLSLVEIPCLGGGIGPGHPGFCAERFRSLTEAESAAAAETTFSLTTTVTPDKAMPPSPVHAPATSGMPVQS